jgi:class 3 adenylate cyclase
MKKPYTPITRKVTLIIVISLLVGIGVITVFFGRSLASTIDSATEQNLSQQSEIMFSSTENFMITDNAPIAVEFFRDIKTRNPNYTIRLFRTSGREAFSDNTTIREVNQNLGTTMFSEHSSRVGSEVEQEGEYFQKAITLPALPVFFRSREGDNVFVHIYKPLINLPKCTRCHGSNHTVRGIIDIENDITSSVDRQKTLILLSAAFFLGMVSILAMVLSLFMRNTVIQPVKEIGLVCSSVTQGDFDKRVSISNTDEIGELGNTVNTMVEGLYERFKLSKYVSTSTIQSLRGSEKGQRVPITMFFSDIRSFTAFSENNTAETVVNHLNNLLTVQTELIMEYGGDIDKYVGDEIVAMFSGEDSELSACRAAMEIQQTLRSQSSSYGGLSVGIGINTGEVILGMIGSEQRADYTVIGDNVNVASRLCDAAKPFQIIISNNTYKKVGDNFSTSGPYRLRVKGKDQYLRVYILENEARERKA